jgi:hydrogenase maturation factor
VEEDKIPVLAECRTICDKLALNPLGLLASGALIITLPASETPRVLRELHHNKVEATLIGKVVEAEAGIKIRTGRGVEELPQFRRDELARFLESLK